MIVFALFLSAIFASTSTEYYEAYKAAVPFIDHVSKSTLPTHGQALIFYGADWCGHCQLFTPIWLEFQKKVKENGWDSHLKIAKVECTEEENIDMCSKLDGYPTVKMFSEGKEKEEFTDRTLDALIKKAEELVKNLDGEPSRLSQLLENEKSSKSNNPDGKVIDLTDSIFETVILILI